MVPYCSISAGLHTCEKRDCEAPSALAGSTYMANTARAANGLPLLVSTSSLYAGVTAATVVALVIVYVVVIDILLFLECYAAQCYRQPYFIFYEGYKLFGRLQS